jgi:hypothetical protein
MRGGPPSGDWSAYRNSTYKAVLARADLIGKLNLDKQNKRIAKLVRDLVASLDLECSPPRLVAASLWLGDFVTSTLCGEKADQIGAWDMGAWDRMVLDLFDRSLSFWHEVARNKSLGNVIGRFHQLYRWHRRTVLSLSAFLMGYAGALFVTRHVFGIPVPQPIAVGAPVVLPALVFNGNIDMRHVG